MHRIQTKPKIDVIMKPIGIYPNYVFLYIKNIGVGSAFNISIDLEGKNNSEGEKILIEDFALNDLFKKGLEYLYPNHEKELVKDFIHRPQGMRWSDRFIYILH